MKIFDAKVPQRDFARVVGCSPALISALVKDGTLRAGGSLAEWTQSFIARETELAGGAGTDEWQKERTALMRLRRQIAQLDHDKLAGRLGLNSAWLEFTRSLVVEVRTGLLRVSDLAVQKALHLLRDEAGAVELFDLIDNEIRAALSAMADAAERGPAPE